MKRFYTEAKAVHDVFGGYNAVWSHGVSAPSETTLLQYELCLVQAAAPAYAYRGDQPAKRGNYPRVYRPYEGKKRKSLQDEYIRVRLIFCCWRV